MLSGMHKKGVVGTLAVVAMLTTAVTVGWADEHERTDRSKDKEGTTDSRQKADDDAKETSTFTGRIVNLHLFLTEAQTPAYGDEEAERPGAEKAVGTLASEVPIGLWIEEDTLVEKAIPGRTVQLIIFNPAEDEHVDAYKQARGFIGKRVKVTAHSYDRGGLEGLLIHDVKEASKSEDSE